MAATAQDVNSNLLAARAAGLRYVNDGEPGITRRRAGGSFSYRAPDGSAVRDEETLQRIRSLAIPPAWTDVWISRSPRGHIQATGRDARGRKQYRYHPLWSQTRDQAKYERTIAFARALPRLRRAVDRDLQRRGLPREKVIAAVIRLLETTMIRVGNEEYARENRSYGLTTLRNRHAAIRGESLKFNFRGKAGVKHSVGVRDRRLARVVRQCQELPGQRLFEYVDDDGVVQPVDSDDVNAYLRDAMGGDFSAKDFRTWAGTVLAARALQELAQDARTGDLEGVARDGGKPTWKELARAVERVAAGLGNTPAVCRKCYIHPAIIDSYFDGTLPQTMARRVEQELEDAGTSLRGEERLVLNVIRRRLAAEVRAASRATRRRAAVAA